MSATIPNLTGFDAGLPANIDAEKTILGAVLLDNSAHTEAAEFLLADDFSLDSHRRIFLRMCGLMDAHHAVDIVTLAEELARYKEVEQVGGVAYLCSLTEGLPRRPVIEEYIKIVKDKALLRSIMAVSQAAIARASDQSETAFEVGAAAQTQLDRLLTRGVRSNLISVGDYLQQNFPTPASMVDKAARTIGLKTGIADFDEMTCGLQRSELIIIAARPSLGKTAFIANVSERAAVDNGLTVAGFSQEMSRESLMIRMICSRSHVNMQRFRRGELNQVERAYFANAHDEFVIPNLLIDDTPKAPLAYIRNACRALKNRGPLDLVWVDHLGLMSTEGAPNKYNRAQEVGWLTGGLKALAKELDVPVVALCQLSRGLTARQDKRPILSDLRESGDIEQDADLVGFLHREEYYEPTDENKGKGELIVAKQRQGPTGICNCAYDATITRWADQNTYVPMGVLPW
jgi:replicative DNA helicase